MRATISSMRSTGKGGSQSGFMAMLMSFMGLSFGNNLKKTGFGILLFVILYAVIFALNTILSACIRGMGWSEYVHSQINYFNPLGVILLIINLPLSYLAFFGEEYGWRYFFQPALQKKYGLRKGVIFLGVLWGFTINSNTSGTAKSGGRSFAVKKISDTP